MRVRLAVIGLLFVMSAARAQQIAVEPHLLQGMYQDCATARHALSSLSDYNAALSRDLRAQLDRANERIRELEAEKVKPKAD